MQFHRCLVSISSSRCLCALPQVDGRGVHDGRTRRPPAGEGHRTAPPERCPGGVERTHPHPDEQYQTPRHEARARASFRPLRAWASLLGRRPVNGSRRRSDIVFRPERVVVYVDGCFWHGCPEHGTMPKQNRQWWMDKLAANRHATPTPMQSSSPTAGLCSGSGSTKTRLPQQQCPRASSRGIRSRSIVRCEAR